MTKAAKTATVSFEPRFERFSWIAEMTEFAVQIALTETSKISFDCGIYTDDGGVTYRPKVWMLIDNGPRDKIVVLEWHDTSVQDGTKFIGSCAKARANESAHWFLERLEFAVRAAQAIPHEITHDPRA
jgi:hypothetical protein